MLYTITYHYRLLYTTVLHTMRPSNYQRLPFHPLEFELRCPETEDKKAEQFCSGTGGDAVSGAKF